MGGEEEPILVQKVSRDLRDCVKDPAW